VGVWVFGRYQGKVRIGQKVTEEGSSVANCGKVAMQVSAGYKWVRVLFCFYVTLI
jgi:hypothetical protein